MVALLPSFFNFFFFTYILSNTSLFREAIIPSLDKGKEFRVSNHFAEDVEYGIALQALVCVSKVLFPRFNTP